MVTYPLTFPSIVPARAEMQMTVATSKSVSPFTFREQVYLHPGERWQGMVEYPPLTREQAAELQAFMLSLKGQYGTFLYGDPNYLLKGARGALGGTPLVDGGSQTGGTLDIKGCSAGVTGWMKKGDYFQHGTGVNARLYMSIADIDTDGAGLATLEFVPNLRVSPADNDAIITAAPKGLMRMAGNSTAWNEEQANIYGMKFAFIEAITN